MAYIQTNRERMCYTGYHAQHLQIRSEILGTCCNAVVAVRLKRARYARAKGDAERMLALRAFILGGRTEDS